MRVANAVRAGAPRPENSRGAHDSTRGCVHSLRVDRIAAELIHSRKPLLEGDAGFLGDVTQLVDDRQNQRDAIFAAPFFCFAFRVAGQEGPVGARSGFGGAKGADVIVNLALAGIPVNETVDVHGPKEMPDAVADAALRNFLAKSERRSERSPIRPTENTAENVHHNG